MSSKPLQSSPLPNGVLLYESNLMLANNKDSQHHHPINPNLMLATIIDTAPQQDAGNNTKLSPPPYKHALLSSLDMTTSIHSPHPPFHQQHSSLPPPPASPPPTVESPQHFSNHHSSEAISPLSIQYSPKHHVASLNCMEPQFTLYEPSLDPMVCLPLIFNPTKTGVKVRTFSSQMSQDNINLARSISSESVSTNTDPSIVHSKKFLDQHSLLPVSAHLVSTTNNTALPVIIDTVHSNQHVVRSTSIHNHQQNGSVVNHQPKVATMRMHVVQSPLYSTHATHQLPKTASELLMSSSNASSSGSTPSISSPNIVVGHSPVTFSSSSTQQDNFHQQKQVRKFDTENIVKKVSPQKQVNLNEEDSSSPLHDGEDSNEMLEDVTIEESMMRCSPYKKITTTETGDVQINHGTWSKEEHEMFLIGLKEAGRNWELIANKYIKSRVRSQVASHAQKYFKKIEKQKKMKLLKAKEALNPNLIWTYYDHSKKN